jgi:hypothetical protein
VQEERQPISLAARSDVKAKAIGVDELMVDWEFGHAVYNPEFGFGIQAGW